MPFGGIFHCIMSLAGETPALMRPVFCCAAPILWEEAICYVRISGKIYWSMSAGEFLIGAPPLLMLCGLRTGIVLIAFLLLPALGRELLYCV